MIHTGQAEKSVRNTERTLCVVMKRSCLIAVQGQGLAVAP